MLDNRGVQCSTGSACNSKSLEPSHVLKAIVNPNNNIDILTGSIRITIDENITLQEITYLVETIKLCVEYLRKKNKNFQKNS
jgi:cysteine desulfurase